MKARDLAAGVDMKLDGNSYRVDLTVKIADTKGFSAKIIEQRSRSQRASL